MAPPIRAAILVASDRASRGEREDRSGSLIQQRLEGLGAQVVEKAVVPDRHDDLTRHIRRLADVLSVDVIVTTGGTGFTARDITPEATAAVIERPAPGIAEAIRLEGLKKTPHAALSRGIAGIRGRTLIVNLPGSTGGVKDGMTVLSSILDHAVETLRSTDGVECGAPS